MLEWQPRLLLPVSSTCAHLPALQCEKMSLSKAHFAQAASVPPLHAAALSGDCNSLQAHIERGADVDEKCCGLTPLFIAVASSEPAAARLLLAAGAKAEVEAAFDGLSAMHLAVEGGAECIDLLAAAGADCNARDKSGAAALHRAVVLDLPQVVAALVAAGAKTEAKDERDFTPLALASYEGRPSCTEALLHAGSRADSVDNVRPPIITQEAARSAKHVCVFRDHMIMTPY